MRLARMIQHRPLASAAALAAFVLLAYFLADAPAARAVNDLADESRQLTAPSGARLVRHESSHKPGQAVIGTEYEASLSYVEVRSFYDSELGRLGWRRVSDAPVKDWDGPVVGYLACYQKVQFWAVLQYFNSPDGQPADYGFDLTWGHSVCS